MKCPPHIALQLNVSRETLDRLELYVSLLLKWNSRINLIAQRSTSDVWRRHVLDSAQLLELTPGNLSPWADLGSGGGLPGLVVAAILSEDGESDVHLVESDRRKATFLRTALRECGIKGNVIAQRIEDCPPLGARVVSARALAPLEKLLGYCQRHLLSDGCALLLKGERALEEVAIARKTWSFDCETIRSATHDSAVILKIGDIQRV